MELGPEDVSLLERCPHFRGCYVQASMELGPELLERCPISEVQASMCVLTSVRCICMHIGIEGDSKNLQRTRYPRLHQCLSGIYQ